MMAKISEYLSALLMIIILTYTLPRFITTLKESYYLLVEAKIKIGILHIKNTFDSAHCFTAHLKKFFLDPEIKGIILLIDCPPPPIATSQAFYKEFIDLKKKFPKITIALLENNCLGSTYYCALGADYIIAQPATLIGNLTKNLVTLSDQESERITTLINKHYIHDILHARPRLSRDVTLWSQQLFTGQEAQKIGLIDELGYMNTIEDILHNKAPIEGDIVLINQRQESFLSQLLASEAACIPAGKNTPFLPAFFSLLTGNH